jgi:hypothetical protein
MATAILFDNLNNKVQDIYPIDYSNINITNPTRTTIVSSILPFRVRFTPIQIESIRDNIPAIPLQIIGYSNYIL